MYWASEATAAATAKAAEAAAPATAAAGDEAHNVKGSATGSLLWQGFVSEALGFEGFKVSGFQWGLGCIELSEFSTGAPFTMTAIKGT